MYSTHNEESLLLLKGLLELWRIKSTNIWLQFHSTIKMKPPDVKSSTYIDFSVENNPTFEVVSHIRR